MKDLISVIITTRNRILKVERAICSVLNQTYNNIEIIVVDDFSNDGTFEYIKNKFPSIIIIRNKKKLGGSGSRNIGIKKSNGLYISFLDDDDYFRKDKIEIQYNTYLKEKNSSLITSRFINLNKNKTLKSKSFQNKLNKGFYYKNIYGGTSNYFLSKKMINKVDGFDENLKSAQDWDFAYRLSKLGNVHECSEFLVFYENDNNSKRISNSVFSTYCGHRDIYLKHKLSMNRINKNKLLFQILYFRALIYKRNRFLLIHKVLQKTDFLFYFKSIIKYYLI